MDASSLLVGGQPVVDRSVADEEKMQREIALLRSNLRKKIPGITVTRELVELLSASPRFCKCKSNFYEAVRGYPKVTKFTLRELNENNRSVRDRWRSNANSLTITSSVLTNCLLLKTTKQR